MGVVDVPPHLAANLTVDPERPTPLPRKEESLPALGAEGSSNRAGGSEALTLSNLGSMVASKVRDC